MEKTILLVVGSPEYNEIIKEAAVEGAKAALAFKDTLERNTSGEATNILDVQIKQLLSELKALRKELNLSQRTEVFAKEAAQILGFKNTRVLKELRDLGRITKFTKRINGKEFIYDKAELQELREKIDAGEILVYLKPKAFRAN
jgi:hypothetical protein